MNILNEKQIAVVSGATGPYDCTCVPGVTLVKATLEACRELCCDGSAEGYITSVNGGYRGGMVKIRRYHPCNEQNSEGAMTGLDILATVAVARAGISAAR